MTAFAPRPVPVLEVRAGLICDASPLVGVLPFLPRDAKRTRALDGDRSTLTFTWDLAVPIAGQNPADVLKKPNVIAVVTTREADGDDFSEHEIATVETTRTAAGGQLVVTATAPRRAFTGAGVIGEGTSAGGVRTTWSVSGLTAQQLVTQYVLPGLPATITLGTVSGAAATVALQNVGGTDLTRDALLDQLVTAVRATGAPCEWWLERVGRTGYQIRLAAQRGAGTTLPELLVGTHLTALGSVDNGDDQMTVGVIRGTPATNDTSSDVSTDATRSIEHALWLVTGVAGSVVTLVDPSNGTGPVMEDGEYVDAVTPYALQARTGRLFAITNTAAPGTFTLAEAATSFSLGDLVELRRDTTSGVTYPAGSRVTVSALGATVGSGRAVTLTGLAGADPVTVDGQYEDARVSYAALIGTQSLTKSGSPPQRYDVQGANNLALFAVGDLLPLGNITYRITALDVVAGWIDVVDDATGVPPGSFGQAAQTYSVYRHVPTKRFRANGAAASANTVVLTPITSTGAALTDLAAGQLLDWETDPSGARVTELASPSGVAAYGRVFRVLTRKSIDPADNVLPNAVLDAWNAGASAPPDGWSVVPYNGTTQPFGTSVARVDGTGISTVHGGVVTPQYGSYLAAFTVRTDGVTGTLTGPASSWLDAGDTNRAGFAVRLFIDADPGAFFAFDGKGNLGLGLAVLVDLLDGTGNVLQTIDPGPAAYCYTAGAWTTFSFADLTLSRGCRARLRFVPKFGQVWTGGTYPSGTPYPVAWTPCLVLVDAAAIGRGTAAPPLRVGSGATQLVQSLHAELAARVTPPRDVRCTVRDLARMSDAWAHAQLTLGADTRARTALGHVAPFDTTVRCTALEESLADPEATTVTLATREQQLAALLAAL